jgi:hypothetical protein
MHLRSHKERPAQAGLSIAWLSSAVAFAESMSAGAIAAAAIRVWHPDADTDEVMP